MAFDPSRAVRVKKKGKAKVSPLAPQQKAAPAKLTNLQRIRLIEQSLEDLRPAFRRDGGDCELVDVEDDRVFVKFSGACRGCQLESVTLHGVQERLIEKLGQPLRVIPVQQAS
jgi:NifU-like protein